MRVIAAFVNIVVAAFAKIVAVAVVVIEFVPASKLLYSAVVMALIIEYSGKTLLKFVAWIIKIR